MHFGAEGQSSPLAPQLGAESVTPFLLMTYFCTLGPQVPKYVSVRAEGAENFGILPVPNTRNWLTVNNGNPLEWLMFIKYISDALLLADVENIDFMQWLMLIDYFLEKW